MVETKHRYLPLDTLRFVAVTLVFFQHAIPGGIWLGRSGVDMFFLLSGFLISGGLIRSEPGNGYFSNFYGRRVLRIFPAYYLNILLAVIFMGAAAMPMVPWAVVFLGNFGYSSPGVGTLGPLAHLWSLAVEEQFYLLWPLLLFFVRSLKMRWILIGVIIVAAPFVRLGLTETFGWASAYSMLPARADGLALGAAIALAQQQWGVQLFQAHRRLLTIAAGIMALVFLGAYWAFPFPTTPHMTITLSASVIFFGCVLAATIAWSGTRVATAMSFRPIVYLGQISFGIYLIHRWLIPYLQQFIAQTWLVVIIAAVGTVGLAMLSFQFFETPISRWGRRALWRRESRASSNQTADTPTGADEEDVAAQEIGARGGT
ncbi:MAG TPA: acyltransferase [Galbitalea sp.]